MTKIIAAAMALALMSAPALADGQHYVRGYVTRSGTYVEPHWQTNADSTPMNNWSTQGNYNPYTAQPGTVNPYANYNTYTQQQYTQPVYQPYTPTTGYQQYQYTPPRPVYPNPY